MTSFQCPRCASRVQDWIGDGPTCAFDESGAFLTVNYRCATLDALRGICEDHVPVSQDDQKYAVLPTWNASDRAPEGVLTDYPLSLWVTWYKHRGRTEGLWLLYDDAPPSIPTLAEVEAIVTFYERTQQ